VSAPKLSYTGLDILQALDRATNYNALLLDLVLRSASDRCRMLDFGAGIGTLAKLLRNAYFAVCVTQNLTAALTRVAIP